MKVQEQAERYAAIFEKQNPGIKVLAATCCERVNDFEESEDKLPEVRIIRSGQSGQQPRGSAGFDDTPDNITRPGAKGEVACCACMERLPAGQQSSLH